MSPETERGILEAIEAAQQAGGQLYAETGLGSEPLPSDIYTGADRYRAEIERVLWRSWVPVARISELTAPGSWLVRRIERAPIVLIRDASGGLHGFHNTCKHRGSLLARADGCGKRLVCPYHAWSYGLDGQLVHVPEPASYPPGFDPAEIGLARISVDTAWGWLWANLRPDPPGLLDFLGPQLLEELENWQLPQLEHKGRLQRDGAFGWKIAVEGFLEPYHVPWVHRRSVHPIIRHQHTAMAWWGDHSRMVMALRDRGLYEPDGFLGRPAAAAGVGCLPRLNTLQRMANLVYLVWPTTILNLLPNHVVMIQLRPRAVDRTDVILDVLAPPTLDEAQADFWAELVAGYASLLDEDASAFAAVQQGLSGPLQPPLILSHYDRRIRHFRSRLEAWLAPES